MSVLMDIINRCMDREREREKDRARENCTFYVQYSNQTHINK